MSTGSSRALSPRCARRSGAIGRPFGSRSCSCISSRTRRPSCALRSSGMSFHPTRARCVRSSPFRSPHRPGQQDRPSEREQDAPEIRRRSSRPLRRRARARRLRPRRRRASRRHSVHPNVSIRSSRSSKNASASISTPTCAFGARSVRCQRSTTVRPRVSSDSVSTSTLRCSVRTIPGRKDVRERDGVVDRRAVPPVGARVVLLEEVDQLGDERADPARGAEALGPLGRQERAVGDVEADHRHVEARARRRAPPPPGRPRC